MSAWLGIAIFAAAYMLISAAGMAIMLFVLLKDDWGWYQYRKHRRQMRKLEYYRAEDWEGQKRLQAQ